MSVPYRPVLFLHIPKTAGTSFLLTLLNTFGDRFVHRLESIDETVPEQLEALIAAGPEQVACITGHLPFHYAQPHLEALQVFTILRHPVERVQSLCRFLHARPAAELERLELKPGFTMMQMLESRHPEVYGQVHDGMVRQLSGERAVLDPNHEVFWQRTLPLQTLRAAQQTLERIDSGICEDMARTLQRAGAAWSVPYALRSYRENVSGAADVDETEDIEIVQRILACNTLDMALYHYCSRAAARRPVGRGSPGQEGSIDCSSVFRAPLGQEVRIGNVPGRSGFHEFEPIGLAWLHEPGPAELHFMGAPGRRRFAIQFHTVSDDYPVEAIAVSLDDRRIGLQLTGGKPRWYGAITEPFDLSDGLHTLAISAPLFIPVSSLQPDSPDARRLGVAVSQLCLEAAIEGA